jgi:hypothetical protein
MRSWSISEQDVAAMHPNEELARREIELINAGDVDALEDLYADDLILHCPGKNPFGGIANGSGIPR